MCNELSIDAGLTSFGATQSGMSGEHVRRKWVSTSKIYPSFHGSFSSADVPPKTFRHLIFSPGVSMFVLATANSST